MPTPIGTVSQLVEIIRSQLASRVDRKSVKSRTSPGRTSLQKEAGNAENLEALIGQRIKAIDRTDPQRGRKAFRIFLESIFLSQFGEHLINDPKFYQLIEGIQSSMEADPEIGKMVDQAIQHLLSASA
ncbi:MAG: hypothetical protein HYS18_05635 [Burkholderiales bacterium]|nr:hypothetical protein [Burkholderiales bacterium]